MNKPITRKIPSADCSTYTSSPRSSPSNEFGWHPSASPPPRRYSASADPIPSSLLFEYLRGWSWTQLPQMLLPCSSSKLSSSTARLATSSIGFVHNAQNGRLSGPLGAILSLRVWGLCRILRWKIGGEGKLAFCARLQSGHRRRVRCQFWGISKLLFWDAKRGGLRCRHRRQYG